MTRIDPPAEAALLEQLRLAHQPPLSIAKAAKSAHISEGRWRQIAKGYQQADKQTRVPVVAPAETLARMADAVGATAEMLEQVGRGDAAAALINLQSQPLRGTPHSPSDEELRLSVIELAVDADAIGSRVYPEDEGRMQHIKAVLRDSAHLVGRLELVALAVADGDANRLHALKQQVKAGRLEEVLRELSSQSSVVDESQVYPPPHLRVHDPDEWVEDRVPRPSQG